MSIDQFREIRQKAGGLVLLLPKHIELMSNEEKEVENRELRYIVFNFNFSLQHLYLLEQSMLTVVSSIPVYFSTYNEDLEKVIEDITVTSDESIKTSQGHGNAGRESAFSEMMTSISANGYQIVVSGASHVPLKTPKIPIVQGELAPIKNVKSNDASSEINTKLPQIIITAHLKTFGLYNVSSVSVQVQKLNSYFY